MQLGRNIMNGNNRLIETLDVFKWIFVPKQRSIIIGLIETLDVFKFHVKNADRFLRRWLIETLDVFKCSSYFALCDYIKINRNIGCI